MKFIDKLMRGKIIKTKKLHGTPQEETNRHIVQLNRLYATLSQINQTIVRMHEKGTLFQEICNIAVEYGKFQMAWIGLLDSSGHVIKPVASAGKVQGYLDHINIDMNDKDRSNGPTGQAFKKGQCIFCQDIALDPVMIPWRDNALKRGYRASSSVPIRQGSEIVGVFTVYAAEPMVFDAKEVQLINEIGVDVSFALDMFEREKQKNLATDQLKKSEERFRSTLDNMMEGGQILDRNWRYLYINHAAEIHNRRPNNELLGKRYMDAWPGIEQLEVFTRLKRCMEEQTTEHMENEFVFPDGTIGWFDLHIQPIPEGIFILSLDITERKLAEDAIKASEKKFRDLFEFSPVGKSITGVDGSLFVNKAFCDILGYTRKELEARNFYDITYPDDMQKSNEMIQLLLKGKATQVRFEKRYLHKNGNVVWTDLSSYMHRDKNGQPQYFISSINDITNRKLAEEKSQKIKEELERFFNLVPDMVCIASSDGYFTSVNHAWTKTLGFSKEELLSRPLSEFIHPDDLAFTNEEINKQINGGFTLNFHNRYRCKDGSFKHLEWVATPAVDGMLYAAARDITDRKIAEEKLMVSERTLKLFVEYAPAAIAMFDRDMKYIAASRRYISDYRLTSHNIIGHSHYEVFPEISGTWKEIHQRCLAGASEEAKEEPFPRLDGTVDWIRWEIHPWYENPHEIGGLLLFSEVVTERKNAEFAIKESEKKYRYLFDKNPQPMWIYDLETLAFLEVNQAAVRHYGYSREEFLSMTLKDIRPKEDIEKLLLDVAATVDELGQPGEWKHIKKNGEFILVEIISHGIEFESKKARLVLASDITAKKEAEKLIKTLSKAVEQSPASIIITDANGNIDFVNAKFTSFMQYQLRDVKGRKPRIFNPGHTSPEEFENMWNTIKSGNTWQGESKNRKKDGTRFWENVIISPMLNVQGQITNYILIMEDITEKKMMLDDLIAAKEKAEESDSLKTAFLHNISHEIRTPMNAIVGFSGFLKDQELTKEKRQHFTDIIVQSSNQLLSIITDIINIATIEAGQGKILESEINLNATIRLLHEQFILKAQKQGITLRYQTPLTDKDTNILTDGTKLSEILTNLIGNAIKFTEQGSVSFGYVLEDNHLKFYVEDTGIGIPADMQDEIFKRFRQVEVNANRRFGGSGLGLSISKAYAELLGGKIWVTSEPGIGSTFYFTIPFKRVTTAVAQQEKVPTENDLHLNKSKCLLIAEDEESNFMLLEEYLSGSGLTIIRATNGAEAVTHCLNNPDIDLVLMDIKMPEMDGYEATKRIRKFRPELPIIAQTAYSSETDKNKAFSYGCNDYISKPIRKDILVAKIMKLFEK